MQCTNHCEQPCNNQISLYFSECKENADVVFIVDSSGSIGQNRFRLMINYVLKVITFLNINSGTRVGMVVYSNNAEVVFRLNEYSKLEDVLNGMNIPYIGGTTNTADALRLTREQLFRQENGDRSDVRNIAVLITDGRSNDVDNTWQEAMLLRNEGVVLLGVGVCSGVQCNELKDIATYTSSGKNVLTVERLEDLDSTVEELAKSLCNSKFSQYLKNCLF